jgi:hypothetical protein
VVGERCHVCNDAEEVRLAQLEVRRHPFAIPGRDGEVGQSDGEVSGSRGALSHKCCVVGCVQSRMRVALHERAAGF